MTLDNPKSHISEAYKTIRTNIKFSSNGNKIKTIVITSPSPDEGKTTTAINLAVTMAQAGSKTIILDCDMRNPKIHRIFKLSNASGLSDYLIGEIEYEQVVQNTGVENLYLLSAGTRPPNPAELLTTEKMLALIKEISREFEYIIIDTPPILIFTDAQILSNYADGSIIIIAAGETEREDLVKARELLKRIDVRILGVVLNKYDVAKKYDKKHSYYYENAKKTKRRRKVKLV